MVNKHITELTTIELDYAVGISEGLDIEYLEDFGFYGIRDKDDPIAAERVPQYSTEWRYGGPLIEKYSMWVRGPVFDGDGCASDFEGDRMLRGYGRTSLEATCRAVVAAKLGEYVDVPDDVNEVED